VRFRFRIKIGRATDDPEKLVLPGAVFCKISDEAATAVSLAVGWWDYHIAFILAWPRMVRTTPNKGSPHHG